MKIAVIGGNSRSARAFVEAAHQWAPAFETISFVRQGAVATGADQLIAVEQYSQISADMLRGCDAVINFVGVVRAATEDEYVRVNAELPVLLADAARAAGATQFIQLSSLSVHGRAQWLDQDTILAPTSAYGRSKLAAERHLLRRHAPPHFHLALLRVPMIYGRRQPSKLKRLVEVWRRVRVMPVSVPLPRRSIICYDNLGRVIVHLLHARRGGVVFAADPQPLSLDLLASILPFAAVLLPLPRALFTPLRWVAPSVHASLFAPMEIAQECLVLPADPPLISTEQALRSAFGDDG